MRKSERLPASQLNGAMSCAYRILFCIFVRLYLQCYSSLEHRRRRMRHQRDCLHLQKKYAQTHGLLSAIVHAVIAVESGWRRESKNDTQSA